MNKNNTNGNICETMLMNYVMLSLYSDKPDKIRITDRMLESILMEVDGGTITKEDVISMIETGPIQFSEEQLQFINNSFVRRMFYKEDKKCVDRTDLIRFVK